VPVDSQRTGAEERARRRRLRAGVLRLGSMLGLDRRQVIRLAEVVTGRTWRECQCVEFEQVVAEYRAIVVRVMARQRRAETDETEAPTHAPAA